VLVLGVEGRVTGAGWAQFGQAPSVEKMLGSLPVVAGFCRRLRIREVIDRLCPMREVSTSVVSHGQMIEVLLANRLTSPTPLADVETWAREWAVGEVFGVLPEALNDDRAGRGLDAIAPVLDKITGSVGLRAIEVFGLDVTRMHWDMTSISLHGAYPDAEEDYAVPKFGHSKDRRPDLKQIQTGLAVTGDGGIPVFHRAYDGGAGEVGQVVGAMQALQQLAGPARMLIVGDSKLISYTNLATMIEEKVTFIAPASKTYVPADVLAVQDLSAATMVDYVAARDAGKPADQRGRWHVREDTMTLAGPRKKDPVLSLRRVFVHSSARASAAATARAKKLDRASDDLARLGRGLGSRHYPDTEAVTARIKAIARDRRVGAYLRATVTTSPDTGKPLLDWHFDQQAIDTEAATDGWYALLTNQTPTEAGPADILRAYKGQEAVERRYHAFKGPLAVAPMFLRNNQRMTALISVICLALLIYCLVEREVRNAIAPATTLPNLYAGRPAKPTAHLIFRALGTLRMIPARNGTPPVIPQPSPHQLHLLNLLTVDPRQPRDG
jgi:transposase